MSNVTYTSGNLTITVAGLDTIENALGDLKSKAPAATKVAINTTARQTRKLMIAQAKARYTVNAAGARHLKDLVPRRKATNKSLWAELHIAKMRNDLGYFQNRPMATFTGVDVFRSAPDVVRARVLRENSLKPLSGEGRLSKGFRVKFSSGHVGMVQRVIESSSENTKTASGKPRWTNKWGNVEKLQTMGSPSATAMHYKVWPLVEPEVEDFLQDELMRQVDRVLTRAGRK